MTLASLLVLASTWDSLWNIPNLYWPFALLGLICGLIAAWWTWCHRWLILARDAKLETEYLNGCVEALESSIPFLASHHETSTKLQALQEQVAAHKDQTERTNATLASRDFEVAKLNHSLTHSREIEQLQARQIAALKTDVLSLTDTLESQDGEALTLKNDIRVYRSRAQRESEKLKAARAEADETCTALALRDAEIAKLKKQTATSNKLVEKQKQLRHAAESTQNSMRKELAMREGHINELKAALTQQQIQLSKAEDVSRKENAKASGLKSKLAGKERVIIELRNALKRNEEALTQMAALREQEARAKTAIQSHETMLRKVTEELPMQESAWLPDRAKVCANGSGEAESNSIMAKQCHEILEIRQELENSGQRLERIKERWNREQRELRRQLAEHAKPEITVAPSPGLGFTSFDGENVTIDQQLGVIYRNRPNQVDNLKQISGVTRLLESRLNRFGIYKYKQIALWASSHEDRISKQLSLGDRIQRDGWKGQAARLHFENYGEDSGYSFATGSVSTPHLKGGDEAVLDTELGLIYIERPSDSDDLKEITGVATAIEKMLNADGIYRFKQVVLWDDNQLAAFSSRLALRNRIELEGWRRQAADLHFRKYGERLNPHNQKASNNRWGRLIERLFSSGDSVTADHNMGIRYTSKPSRVDDLKRVSGVAETLEKELHYNGVYQFKQIALWGRPQIAAFSERLSFPDLIEREEWVSQAASLHYEEYGEDLALHMVSTRVSREDGKTEDRKAGEPGEESSDNSQVSDSLGNMARQRPHTVDDLTRIKGIAKVIEAKLHSVGIYRFKQIADWSQEQADAFSKKLSFKGRIERDEWMSQAASLHEQDYGKELHT